MADTLTDSPLRMHQPSENDFLRARHKAEQGNYSGLKAAHASLRDFYLAQSAELMNTPFLYRKHNGVYLTDRTIATLGQIYANLAILAQKKTAKESYQIYLISSLLQEQDEAQRHIERAMGLDPYNPIYQDLAFKKYDGIFKDDAFLKWIKN